jgi:transposase
MKRNRPKPVFKPYHPNQNLLFPPNLEDLIAEHHPVRVVSKVIDQLDISLLIASYKGGGSSSYHPKMLLKVLIYAYLRNIYSSRKIEEALEENIHFMWLSGMSKPDHSTISAFRSKRLKGQIKIIFTQVVLLLAEEGLVDIKTLYTDGTKLEANANRYTFVWGKSVKRYKKRIEERLAALWNYVEETLKAEEQELEAVNFEAISVEKAKQVVEQIEAALKDREVSAQVKKNSKN